MSGMLAAACTTHVPFSNPSIPLLCLPFSNASPQGPEIVIHHSDEVLNNMNAWCIEHHGKSGLTQKSRDSTVTMEEAEEQLLEFIAAHTPYQSAQLAGNSVHVDRLFLMKYMPRVVEHLHYRIVDVSTVGELCR